VMESQVGFERTEHISRIMHSASSVVSQLGQLPTLRRRFSPTPLYRVCLRRPTIILFHSIALINYEQDRQCTCDVTLRRVRATIAAVESNTYYIF